VCRFCYRKIGAFLFFVTDHVFIGTELQLPNSMEYSSSFYLFFVAQVRHPVQLRTTDLRCSGIDTEI
jgi:hypothetical protein